MELAKDGVFYRSEDVEIEEQDLYNMAEFGGLWREAWAAFRVSVRQQQEASEAKLDHKAVSALFTKFDGQKRRAFSLLLASWKVERMSDTISDAIAGVGEYEGDPRKIIVQTAETWGTSGSGVMGREIARVEELDGSGKFGTESFLHGEMDLSPLAALRGYLTNDFPMWAWRVEEIPRVTPEGVEKVDKVLVRDGRPGVWRMLPGGVLERRVEGRPVQAAVGNTLAAWLQQIPAFGAVGWEKPKGGGQVVMTLPTDDRKEGRELYLKIQALAKGEFGKTKRAKALTDEERETLSNEAAKTIKALQVSAGRGWIPRKRTTRKRCRKNGLW